MKKTVGSIAKLVAFFFTWAVLIGLVDFPSKDPMIWRFFAELLPLVCILLLTLIFLKIEKGQVKIRIFHHWKRASLVGVFVGILWLAIPAVLLIGTKELEIVSKSPVPYLWIWILAAFINVVMQEFLVRGYMYEFLKSKYNLKLAVIFSTLLFTLLHGAAFEAGVIPVLNVLTMCLFTTFLFETEGSLMAPIMAHAVWNIVGGILFGVIHLAEDYPSIYTMVASSKGLLSGGDFMLEGSILVTLVNLVFLLFFLAFWKKQGKRTGKASRE